MCRVPAIVAIAILIMGAAVEQIHEVVRVHLLDLDDPVRDEVSGWNLVALYVLLYLLTWSILFWSEYAIAQRFSVALKRSAVLRFAFRGFPILLAAMPWVGAFLALRAAAIGLPDHLRLLAYVLCGVVVFFGVVSIATFFSRDVLKTIRRAGVAYRGDAATPEFTHSSLLFIWFVLGLALFLVATIDPWLLGESLGTIGVMLAAALAALPFLTWLTTSQSIPRWHWLSILFGIAALWSAFDLNDNHPVRALRVEQAPLAVPSFSEAFGKWLAARVPPDNQEPYPVVLVAAEGGGIRAAYFSAQVLAAIQDRCPAFAEHLFAVSGVSGGSVGAAVFAGLVDARPAGAAREKPSCDTEVPAATPIAEQTDAILRMDFLAPLAATLLFPDALQRFLPFPIDRWDRARTLELTVERTFEEVVRSDFMQRGLYGYWRPDGRVPLLLFNTTHVASGARLVASPVQFAHERFRGLVSLYDHALTLEPRLSTAAFLSARFPYVTPAAYVGGNPKHRYVDGGYFENSGTTTLSEVLDVVLTEAEGLGRRIYPIVVRIGNSPSRLVATDRRPAGFEVLDPPSDALGELLSPVRAMFNTRDARGALAAEDLEVEVASLLDSGQIARYVEFQIALAEVQTPLGWQLSQAARNELRDQLTSTSRCDGRVGIVNACAIVDVVEVLAEYRSRAPSRENARTAPAAGRQ